MKKGHDGKWHVTFVIPLTLEAGTEVSEKEAKRLLKEVKKPKQKQNKVKLPWRKHASDS